MKSFLVIGMGRFGTAVAQELTELGQEVLAIDENVESVQRIADDVTQVMQGDAQDEAVLGAVGVRNFDCCIVAVGTDMEASILITVMLKDLGAQYIIAKARSTVHAKVLERVGADRVVLTESEMGCKLAQRPGTCQRGGFYRRVGRIQHSGDTRAEKLGRQIAGAA